MVASAQPRAPGGIVAGRQVVGVVGPGPGAQGHDQQAQNAGRFHVRGSGRRPGVTVSELETEERETKKKKKCIRGRGEGKTMKKKKKNVQSHTGLGGPDRVTLNRIIVWNRVRTGTVLTVGRVIYREQISKKKSRNNFENIADGGVQG